MLQTRGRFLYSLRGKGIVVEYINGKLNIHDHIGVMTNSPAYDWHVTNLRNYINLSPKNPKPVIANGMTYAATGQGAGMLGFPGDIPKFLQNAYFEVSRRWGIFKGEKCNSPP